MVRCYACSSITIMQDRFMLQGSKRPGSELSRLLLQQLHIFCRILNRTGPTLTFAGSVTFLLLIHHQLFWIVFSGYAILGVPIVFIQLELGHEGQQYMFEDTLRGQFQLWAISIYFERPIWDTLTLSEEVCSFPGAFTTTASTTCMCSALVSGNGQR